MMQNPFDPALQGAVCFYSVSVYPIFQSVGWTEARKIADAAGQFVLETAPCRDASGQFSTRDLPHVGNRSIIYAVAVMTAFLVWAYSGKNLPASPLLDAARNGYFLAGSPPCEFKDPPLPPWLPYLQGTLF